MRKNYIYLLLFPGILLLLLFEIIPLISTIIPTFFQDETFTFQSYLDFFTNRSSMKIFYRTLKLSLISTLICVILGFPTSYYIAKTNMKKRGLYIALAVFPLLTSPVVRSFSWMVVLGKKGLLNTFLLNLNLIETPFNLLFNEISIVIGLVHLFLPLMILSLVGVMENIEHDLLMAAKSLGASSFTAFMKVVFPLSIPGVIVGSVLVFTGSLTAYTTPQLLGGPKSKVMANLIYQNAMTLFDWNTAAVVSVVMIITTMIIISIINTLGKRLNPKG